MKQLLKILVFLAVGQTVYGQIYTKPNNSYGLIYNRSRFDSTIFLPTRCGTPVGLPDLSSTDQNMMALQFDSCGHRLYLFDPSLKSWFSTSGASQLNDSVFVVGLDTVTIRGTGGGTDPSKVPLTRTITINGNSQDLSANRTWTLTKSDIGLGNVDNTSDVNKPVSTAQQAALDMKLNKADTAAMLSPYVRRPELDDTSVAIRSALVDSAAALRGAFVPMNFLGNTTVTQNNFPLRLQNGISYTEINGGVTTVQVDSTKLPYMNRVYPPFGGTPAQGILPWVQGMTTNPQTPSRPNYPMMWGWNLHPGGTSLIPGYPAIGYSLEPNYRPSPSSATPWLQEAHLYYITPQQKQVRLWSSTVNTSTNDYDFYFTTRTWGIQDSSLRKFVAITQNLSNQSMSMELGSSAVHKDVITVDPVGNVTSITTTGTSKATAQFRISDFGNGLRVNAGGVDITGNGTYNGNLLPNATGTWQVGAPTNRWLKVNTDQLNGARNVIGNIAAWGSTAGIYPLAIVPENSTAANTTIRMYPSSIGTTSLFELKNNGNVKINPATVDAVADAWLDLNGDAFIKDSLRIGIIRTGATSDSLLVTNNKNIRKVRAADVITAVLAAGAISTPGLTITGLSGTGTRLSSTSSAGISGAIANGIDGQVMTMVSGSPTWADAPTSGTYNPTFSNLGTDVSSVTATNSKVWYTRVGKVVTITGRVDPVFSAGTAGDSKTFSMSLPPGMTASFASNNDGQGVANCTFSTTRTAIVQADATNDIILFTVTLGTEGYSASIGVHFTVSFEIQ